ncbi:hypothetical protein OG462_31175 [Streptomyces sp. NBC_01077]|uniref:hypothetical protein n=1 Tax=Streptomyces sp. NBC_01077 TaxID=2903746 RepID=UPI00386B7780|nr:hypothetical protein OG462_31175 [Streptomyces sp. NBC_01077]
MMVLALTGVLVLAVGGCVCVVWAARGGPRWVRAIAAVTLAIGSVLRGTNRRRSVGSGGGDSWDNGGGGGGGD